MVVPDYSLPEPAYDSRNLKKIVRFVPVKDKDMLSVVWTLPSSEFEYKTQPLKYHSHLFGHEGENSLLSYLISEGLALELSSAHDHSLKGAFSNLTVDISLTKKGIAEYERVVQAVFHFARIVRDRGVQEYVFNECKRIGELKFEFLEKSQPMQYVTRLAGKMQEFDTEATLPDILRHSYIVQELDRARTQQMSDLLADPSNVNLYLRSQSFGEACTLVEPWFTTKYSVESISEHLLSLMTTVDVPLSAGKKKLDLPPPNNLLPKNLDVLPESGEDCTRKPTMLS